MYTFIDTFYNLMSTLISGVNVIYSGYYGGAYMAAMLIAVLIVVFGLRIIFGGSKSC